MALDPEYLDAIKGFEGYAPAGSWDYKQYSSGYGTKAQPGDDNIPPDQLRAIHEQRYREEIARAEAHVDNVNPNLPPGARAALTSLTYNAGPGWSQSGLGDLVRQGDLQGAAARFLEYNKAGGEVNPGLVARRQKEAAWFGGGLPQGAPATRAAPLNAIPQASAPMFAPLPQAQQAQQAQQPQQMPQAQQAPEPAGFDQIPMGQSPPIFFPHRKPIDLARLRAAFNQPNFYGRT